MHDIKMTYYLHQRKEIVKLFEADKANKLISVNL